MDECAVVGLDEEGARVELWQTLQALQQHMHQLEQATKGQFDASTAFAEFAKEECHLDDLSVVAPFALLYQQLQQTVLRRTGMGLAAKTTYM